MVSLALKVVIWCHWKEKCPCTGGVTKRKNAPTSLVSLKRKHIPASVVSLKEFFFPYIDGVAERNTTIKLHPHPTVQLSHPPKPLNRKLYIQSLVHKEQMPGGWAVILCVSLTAQSLLLHWKCAVTKGSRGLVVEVAVLSKDVLCMKKIPFHRSEHTEPPLAVSHAAKILVIWKDSDIDTYLLSIQCQS